MAEGRGLSRMATNEPVQNTDENATCPHCGHFVDWHEGGPVAFRCKADKCRCNVDKDVKLIDVGPPWMRPGEAEGWGSAGQMQKGMV